MQYCNKCGAQMGDQDAFCGVCGAPKSAAGGICPVCGGPVAAGDQFCAKCGAATGNPAQPQEEGPKVYQGEVYGGKPQRSKLVAGLLGIFVGGLGIHNFYLGKVGIGVVQIVLTLCSCGLASIWGFIEGILILCDRITVDGDGNPLAP